MPDISGFVHSPLYERLTVGFFCLTLGLMLAAVLSGPTVDRVTAIGFAAVAGLIALVSAVNLVVTASSWDGAVAANGLLTIFLALPYCRRNPCERSK